VLAFAIRPAPAEPDISEVLLGLSPKLLAPLVIVAHSKAVPRVAPDVVDRLVMVLTQGLVLGLELFVYCLNLAASFIEFVLLRRLAPEVLPELVLLQSSLHQEAEEALEVLFESDDLLCWNVVIIHRLVPSV